MTESSTRIARTLAQVILLGAALRIVASVVAGIIEWAQNGDQGYPNGTFRAGDILDTVGDAGDGVGVLLALAALALVWWLLAVDEPVEGLRSAAATVLGLTAVSAFVQVLGFMLLFSIAPESTLWSQLVLRVGHSLVYAIVALGGVAAARRLAGLVRAQAVQRFDDDPLVFAIDRLSGDVHAYFSVDTAERKSHVYSVEDDELAFYTDEGKVVRASAEHDRVVLTPTDVDQRDALLERLREFVVRRGLHVHPDDADDPTAYAKPISEWQWLQLWPGWLRWMGRIVRPR